MVLPVSLSQHQNGRNCDGRDGELGTLHENEREDKSVNVATTPWCPCWERWVWGRAAVPSEANKACGRLHILTFCVVQERAHILELDTYALPSFSNFLHFVAHASLIPRLVHAPHTHEPGNEASMCMTEKHMPCLLTNIHTCWFKGHGDVRESYSTNTNSLYYTHTLNSSWRSGLGGNKELSVCVGMCLFLTSPNCSCQT